MDEDVRIAIAYMREHFETVIAANEDRNRVETKGQERALQLAMAANDKRLDSMNEFRLALTDQATRMVGRTELETVKTFYDEKFEVARAATEAKFDAELRPLNRRVTEIRRPNWALMASMASIFLVIIGGVWLVIGLKIDASVLPLGTHMEISKAQLASLSSRLFVTEAKASESTNADVISVTDRHQLNDRVRVLEGALVSGAAERRGQIQTLQARLVEVETQFCASDVVRNLMHANDMRTASLMWHQVFKNSSIPTDNAYYPQICNRPDMANGN